MSDETTLSDTQWQYEVDSVQRGGTTAATLARRHGEVSHPEETDNHDAKDTTENQYDSFGIPENV